MDIQKLIKEELDRLLKEEFYLQFEDWYKPSGQTLSGMDEGMFGYAQDLQVPLEKIRDVMSKISDLKAKIGAQNIPLYNELTSIWEMLRAIHEEILRMPGDANKNKKVEEQETNPWAVCHSSVGPEKTDKFERCVKDVKKQHGMKENGFDLETIVREEVKNLLNNKYSNLNEEGFTAQDAYERSQNGDPVMISMKKVDKLLQHHGFTWSDLMDDPEMANIINRSKEVGNVVDAWTILSWLGY